MIAMRLERCEHALWIGCTRVRFTREAAVAQVAFVEVPAQVFPFDLILSMHPEKAMIPNLQSRRRRRCRHRYLIWSLRM
jgi:hypothetical protein